MEVGIIGLGLIGGSLAKVFKKRCGSKVIAYNRSQENVKCAFAENIIDEYIYGDFETADLTIFSNCDIIFVCTPINRICQNIKKLIPFIKDDCIVTDVGSTKNSILETIKTFGGINFIGGHPMAGSEQTGYQSSKEHLFENAFYILAPLENVSCEKIDYFKNAIDSTGAITILMNPSVHDETVSAISHGPHIVASALVNIVEKLDSNKKFMHTLAAGGFKDITRIASSSPEIWTSISLDNKLEVVKFLKKYVLELEEVIVNLNEENENEVYSFFEKSRTYRDTFLQSKRKFSNDYSISVDCEDKTGIIATVATILSFNNVNIKNIGIINNREYENGVLQILFNTKEELDKSIVLLENMNFVVYKED